MEKYLILLIIIVVVYYLFRYCIQLEVEKIIKTKEGFAATTGGDADVASSINTLAQIANDLQTGKGLNVPGVLNILGAINTDETINAKKNLSVGNGSQQLAGSIILKGGTTEDGYIVFSR